MRLVNAIDIGKDCGLSTINECITNIEIHSMNFFEYSKIDEELNKLMLDINELAKKYNETTEEVLNWSIKEYEIYER